MIVFPLSCPLVIGHCCASTTSSTPSRLGGRVWFILPITFTFTTTGGVSLYTAILFSLITILSSRRLSLGSTLNSRRSSRELPKIRRSSGVRRRTRISRKDMRVVWKVSGIVLRNLLSLSETGVSLEGGCLGEIR